MSHPGDVRGRTKKVTKHESWSINQVMGGKIACDLTSYIAGGGGATILASVSFFRLRLMSPELL